MSEKEFLTISEVCEKVGGIGSSTLYRWIKRGLFPRQIHFGPRRSFWLAEEVEAWRQAQITAERQQAA